MKTTNWNTIKTEKDVLDIIEKSKDKPQIIFKDSVSCGISAFAKERLKNDSPLIESISAFNYLDLLSYREVSNFIAKKLNVIHQSPQIIVLTQITQLKFFEISLWGNPKFRRTIFCVFW